MASNQLLERRPEKPGRVTVEVLEDLAASLNGEWWVKHLGRHYFVSREVVGDKVVHSLAWQQLRA